MAIENKHFRSFIYFIDLLRELTSKELKILYKRSVIGIAWTLINPILQLIVFYFVFRSVLALKIPHYASFIFCGMLVWNWFSSSLTQGTSSIIANPTFVRQPGFPISILPVVVVSTGMVHFCIALPILTAFLMIEGAPLHPLLLELPILMAIQFGFSVGLTYILAAINVTFRDTRHTIGILLQLGFYLTPVFYELKNVPEKFLPYYLLNPMTHLVNGYRDILLFGRQPNWQTLGVLALVTVGLVIVSHAFFIRQSRRFAEEL
jgi:lipopolysaccharide transport system permease protein